jgi:Domain of unknown function (DUF4272)
VDEDFVDIELRPAREVAERCIILATLVRRLWIESSFTSTDAGDRSAEAFDLREWLRAEGLWNSLTSSEVDFLQQNVGGVTEDQSAIVAWQAEGLVTLSWALGLVDLSPPGKLGNITTVVQAVPAPWDNIKEWILNACLRPEMEIAAERDRAEVLEWRIGIEGPRRRSTGEESAEYLATIAEVIDEARASALLEFDGGTDFMIGSSLVTSVADQDLERLSALAEERLRALNWLCGYGTNWDAVPLDV